MKISSWSFFASNEAYNSYIYIYSFLNKAIRVATAKQQEDSSALKIQYMLGKSLRETAKCIDLVTTNHFWMSDDSICLLTGIHVHGYTY